GLALQGSRVTLGDLAAGIQMFEPMCAAECARRADRRAEVVPLLAANIDESAQSVDGGAAFTHIARQFHELVVALTPNATLRCVARPLGAWWPRKEALWARSLSSRGESPSAPQARKVVPPHGRILAAIDDGDDGEAERLSRSHLAASQAFLVARFDDGVVTAG